jgi:hypothetical protein
MGKRKGREEEERGKKVRNMENKNKKGGKC